MKEITQRSLDMYAEGYATGGFLRALLANDLFEAFASADPDNLRDMREIVRYVYNELPSECWGSYEKVDMWLEKKKKEKAYEAETAEAGRGEGEGCRKR